MGNVERPIIVTSYRNPDLDGVSGSIAYSEFLLRGNKDSVAMIDGKAQNEAKWLLERIRIEPLSLSLQPDTLIVLIDVSDPDEINSVINPDNVMEVIDHRRIHNAHKFSKDNTYNQEIMSENVHKAHDDVKKTIEPAS